MTTRPTPVPRALLAIRPTAEPAWRRLSAVLDAMRDDGRRPPLRRHRRQVVPRPGRGRRRVRLVPRTDPSLAFAVANREPCGTWGGRDFTTPTDHDDDERTTAA